MKHSIIIKRVPIDVHNDKVIADAVQQYSSCGNVFRFKHHNVATGTIRLGFYGCRKME